LLVHRPQSSMLLLDHCDLLITNSLAFAGLCQ